MNWKSFSFNIALLSKSTIPSRFRLRIPNHCSTQIRHQPRPMSPAWARDLRDQCISAGASFFFKQWDAHDERCEYVGKRDVGRLLDGVEWSQVPQ